jgi:hypothetical protein
MVICIRRESLGVHRSSSEPAWPPAACASRCFQNGLEKKVDRSRKQMKERRKRAKKVRGVKKNASGKLDSSVCAGRGQ